MLEVNPVTGVQNNINNNNNDNNTFKNKVYL